MNGQRSTSSEFKMSWRTIVFLKQPSSLVFSYTILASLVLFLVWGVIGFFISVHDTIKSPAVVVADLGVRAIQSPQRGVLIQLVAENSEIKENDLLGYIQTKGGSRKNLVELVRVLEEVVNSPNTDVQSLLAQFEESANIVRAQTSDVEAGEVIQQLISDIDGYKNSQRTLSLSNRKETASLVSIQNKNRAKLRALRVGKMQKEMKYFVDSIETEMSGVESKIAQINSSYQQKGESAKQDLLSSLRRTFAKLQAISQGLEVRAPVSGRISKWYKQHKSEVLSTDIVAEILPKGSRAALQIQTEQRYLPRVKPGQLVSLKLESFPFERYGVFVARVDEVKRVKSADGWFEVRAQFSGTQPVHVSEIPLGSGANAEIVVRNTSLNQFLWNRIFGERF
ncbi:MAG: HlyD family efflux transporter periplasmic adaptor subunit [Bdellovibrionales bacterium]|nr:HlyD family efflux transporter periplasmic adaptor subunit [Bdellovibrionales bacterium]